MKMTVRFEYVDGVPVLILPKRTKQVQTRAIVAWLEDCRQHGMLRIGPASVAKRAEGLQ